MRYTATPDGRAGLRKHRSHELVAIDDCRIASMGLPSVGHALTGGAADVEAVVTATQEQVVLAGEGDSPLVTEEAVGRRWTLHASDFWQVHPGAADSLAAAVVDGLVPAPGERCWDLYSGVGLFSAVLAAGVGERGSVVAVESRRCAAEHARSNLAGYTQVRCEGERVERFVRSRIAQGRLDIVVLDPPRRGAGAEVVRAIARQQPRAIAYVACDPAALARDLATLQGCGYRLASLRAFDIFPMTHHVECVAIITRTAGEVS
jgi:tRNA/tmRNA/rRNA uracil-C5-methylase (TrmA/RlmC/RlmD family)